MCRPMRHTDATQKTQDNEGCSCSCPCNVCTCVYTLKLMYIRAINDQSSLSDSSMLAPAQLLLCYLYQSALLIPCAVVNCHQHNKVRSTQGFVQWSFSIRAAPNKPYFGQKLASAGLWHQGADGACPAPGCAFPRKSASCAGIQPYDFGSWQSTSVQRMTCIHNRNDSGSGYLSCWHTSNS